QSRSLYTVSEWVWIQSRARLSGPRTRSTRVAGVAALGVLCCLALLSGTAVAAPPLKLLGRTPIAGYEGDFDHLAADVSGNRLFVAGEEQGSLLVFDLATGALRKAVKGFDEPHGIHYARHSYKLFVADRRKCL